jgi:hypothetical protein
MAPECDYCAALLVEMYSCITETRAIVEDLHAHIASGVKINPNSSTWYQSAVARSHDVAAKLSDHLPTHKIRVTLASESRN